jgi:polygalacturonase
MKFNSIATTSRSITIEIENNSAFFCEDTYDVYINQKKYTENEVKNVISFFGLEPNTAYEILLQGNKTNRQCLKKITTQLEYVRFNVKEFGAKGDGKNLDSVFIQAAILACPHNGTVYIPRGVYSCGPLFLKSNMTLEIDEDAVLLGHSDRNLYPILPGCTMTSDEKDEYYLGTWEGNPLDSHASLITAIDLENVAIIGKGIIDGNAGNSDWWIEPKRKRAAWRPRTLFFKGCTNVLVQGLTIKNSPSWTIHPYLSSYLDFIDLHVENHKDSPNTDGLDPESCFNVQIIGVDFSVGDDCIAIKSGKLYMGRRLKRPSKEFVIRNCRMRHGHGAVVIGSEMSGGVTDILVRQCIFEKTDRGLRIKTRRGRGCDGIIDNIVFEYITMKEVLTPFVMNMFYFCDPDGKTEYVWSKEPIPIDEWTPQLKCFTFKQIHCIDAQWAAAYFQGLPEQPIKEVIMEDIYVKFKDTAGFGQPAMMSFAEPISKQSIIASHIQKMYLKNVVIEGYEGERLCLTHVDDMKDN